MIYLIVATVLGAGFLGYAVALYRRRDGRLPMRTFGYSIYYLLGIFAGLLVDHHARSGVGGNRPRRGAARRPSRSGQMSISLRSLLRAFFSS